MLYVGPTMKHVTEQIEPRFVELVDQSARLSAKRPFRKETQTRKVIAGAVVRLAHGGSSAALKSDSFVLSFIDEYVEMLGKSKKAGRVLELVEARGEAYGEEYSVVVTSTPSMGVADVEQDPDSGLEFWKINEECECPAWRLWQEGTGYHWAWPCPHCLAWFIPRHQLLRWAGYPLGTAVEAERSAYLECPRCKRQILNADKRWMNERGQYVSKGQTIDEEGNLVGDPVESPFISFWVSGLASPFKSFGDRAFALRLAQESNDANAIRTTLNAFFGEIWAPSGPDTPDWTEVRKCTGRYKLAHYYGEMIDTPLPQGLHWLTAAVDVQKRSLVYVIRGWGARATSWMVGYGELPGNTSEWEIWEDLADLLSMPIGGKRIRLALIDSGFRPDKSEPGNESVVYDFCRRYERFCRAAKGASSRLEEPLRRSRIEVSYNGGRDKYGLELFRIDTDWSKSWVHQHVRWEKDREGAWFIGDGTTEEYYKQIVSEARIRAPDGKPGYIWVRRSKQNHFLDCEAMNFIAGWYLRAHRIPPAARVPTATSENGDDQQQPNRRVIQSPLEIPAVPVVQAPRGNGNAPRARVIPSPFIG